MSDPSAEPPAECFVDTNVWLYAFIVGSQPDKHILAESLIRREQRIVLSVQVINEVSVNLLKKAAFSETNIRLLIDSFYQRYRIVSLDQSILNRASSLRERYQFSFWDGLIVSCALTTDATTLYSEDMHNGLVIEGRLRIVNPFLAEDKIENEKTIS
jgi:predicted nucleic acid-binding protein